MIERENGEISSASLYIIASDSPVECAIYAKDNSLFDTQGRKCFKPNA